jgi:hypothetical protein
VRLPGVPDVSTERDGTGSAEAVKKSYVLPIRGHGIFIISTIEFKTAIASKAYTDASLNALIAAAQKDGGKILSRGEIEAGTCHGSEVQLGQMSRGTSTLGLGQARVFASGARLYFLYATDPVDTPEARAIIDRFLDSFTIPGGCADVPLPTAGSPAKINGTPDAASGLLRIDSPHGISFLSPTAPELAEESFHAPVGELRHYNYVLTESTWTGSVDITEGYKLAGKPDTATAGVTFDSVAKSISAELAKVRLKLDEGRSLDHSPVPGREYSVHDANNKRRGRLRIYLTPSRIFQIYVLEASVSPEADSAEKPWINSLFDSLKLDPS